MGCNQRCFGDFVCGDEKQIKSKLGHYRQAARTGFKANSTGILTSSSLWARLAISRISRASFLEIAGSILPERVMPVEVCAGKFARQEAVESWE
jgi:hypothetical protein